MTVPDQQTAIRRMRKLRDQGLAFRTIAERMKAAGFNISHMGVKSTLRHSAEIEPKGHRH